MIATSIVIFREFLEISLILGVVLAATHNVKGRIFLITNGILGGVFCSILIGLFADKITKSLDGFGQEYLNAFILFITIILIGWTVVWMSKKAPKLASEMKNKTIKISEAGDSLYMISLIICTSFIREGAEIVLFLQGIKATGVTTAEIITGFSIGAILGLLIGIGLYLGLLKLPPKYFFKTSSLLLIILAASLASQLASYLSAADLINSLDYQAWDTSSIITQESILGKILNTLIGYNAKPTILQIIFYLSTILIFIKIDRMKSVN